MRSFGSKALGVAGLLVLIAGTAASGCVSQENERTLELAVGTRCTLNSDCTSPNVCVFGVCHEQCNTSADCAHNEHCVKGDKGGGNVCQLANEATCATSADCVGEQVCGVDGKCRDGCKSASECLVGQVCTQGTCADQAEVDGSSGKLPEDPAHVGEGQPCIYNSDCPDPLGCVQSTCAYQCNGDRDCPPGDTCTDHVCIVPTTPPPVTPECVHNKDCDLGSICTAGNCVAGCLYDSGCPSGSRCIAAQCETPIFSATNSPQAITADGANLFAIYNGEVISCPATGCNSTNITDLFQAPDPFMSGGLPTVQLKIPTNTGSYTTQRFEPGQFNVFSNGGVTFAVVPDGYDNYSTYYWGCFDAACSQMGQVHDSSGHLLAVTMYGTQGQAVFYTYTDDGEGHNFGRCMRDSKQPDFCNNGFNFNQPDTSSRFVSSLAVQRGATPDNDIVFVGYSDGTIDTYDVNACNMTEACGPTSFTTVVDDIGLPAEVGNMAIDGGYLYWMIAGDNGSKTPYRIERCMIGSTCTPELVYKANATHTPAMGVATSDLLVWDDGSVWSVPKAP